jgi:hypothetical protein
MQFQRQYNLRNQKVPPNPPKGNPTKEAQSNIPSTSQPKNDYVAKDSTIKGTAEKGKQKEEPQKKLLEVRKETVTKQVEKTSSSFNSESEMAKIKIYIPFNELIKISEYRNQIIRMLKMGQTSDTLNIQDDHPAILFGPRVEESHENEEVSFLCQFENPQHDSAQCYVRFGRISQPNAQSGHGPIGSQCHKTL